MIEKDDWRLLNDYDFLRGQYLDPVSSNEIIEHLPNLKHCHFCWEIIPDRISYCQTWYITSNREDRIIAQKEEKVNQKGASSACEACSVHLVFIVLTFREHIADDSDGIAGEYRLIPTAFTLAGGFLYFLVFTNDFDTSGMTLQDSFPSLYEKYQRKKWLFFQLFHGANLPVAIAIYFVWECDLRIGRVI